MEPTTTLSKSTVETGQQAVSHSTFVARSDNNTAPLQSKTCTGCSKSKPVDCFGVKRRHLSGMARWENLCKVCDSKSRKKRYTKKKVLARQERKFKRVVDFNSIQTSEFVADEILSPVGLNDLLRNLIFDVICSTP